ncbi:LysR family transcriptional regulator [Marinibactrum halimedae]|uniref:LysR family transcriptional regulator n=1 Tax=Marinibactrum halimedae TaxID=1444977 RepID=A0AA37T0R4_9GAMM|nr:LysR family transcriptional regulator [Marinibactrum halimedae]MCD9459103.1 LysR family transcriptional regulator [Marinibactrum halimedae]GLS24704.1 LysR family transcriptional regulator [Marinibactrum halimedae]
MNTLQKIDLNLFVVFAAIYQERNLTRAAETLFITQPAVSNALNRLRALYDDELFIRSGKSMVPTPTAEAMIEKVRAALNLMQDSLMANSKTFTPELSSHGISCSMNDLAESMILPRLLKHLKQSAPGMTLSSYYVQRDRLIHELAARRLDFAIDVPLIADPQLRHSQLHEDAYVCAVRKRHPLAKPSLEKQSLAKPSLAKHSLDLSTYLNAKHLHISSRRHGSNTVDLCLQQLGEHRDIRVRLQHYLLAPKILESTDLLWTLPKTLATQLKLHYFPLPFHVPAVEWHLFWHKNTDNDPLQCWLRELITIIATSS